MKKNKLLLSAMLLASVIGLSSCSYITGLFNDDDIAIHNEYNPPAQSEEEQTPTDPSAIVAGGVVGKEVESVPDTLRFKNICYATDGKILNTYKEGGINENEFNVNNGLDYEGDKSSNNYDLYVPDAASRDGKHVVVLFIHGGAWVSGFKTDVNPYIQEFAKEGYITATIKYTLLKRTMDDSSLSIFRDLDEIDACIASIKHVLGNDLGFDTTKTNLVIGGASSGAHLAMLYSYSRGSRSPLPIKFIVDAVGPVDIKPENWKAFKYPDSGVSAGLDKDAIASQELVQLAIAGEESENPYWNDYQTMRVANGMCGIPYSLEDIHATTDDNASISHPNAASTAMTKVNGGEDQLSVTYWINKVSGTSELFPIICAYAGRDSIVGVKQYSTLQVALESKGISSSNFKYFYFQESNHQEITPEKDATAYNNFMNEIKSWCSSLVA